MQTAPRLHLRCAACGKLSQPGAFTGDHDLEALTQSFIGGGRGKGQSHGFKWRKEPLEPAQAELIRDALRGAEKRIDEMLGGAGAATDKEDLASMSASQLKRLHKEAIEREAAIAKARKVPSVAEQIDPPSIAKLRKAYEHDRETIRLQVIQIETLAERVRELESE